MVRRNLLADMAIDKLFVPVVFREGPSRIHRTAFDGQTAQLRAVCGAQAKGYWRIVPEEYSEARVCLNCRRIMVNMTHGSKK